MKSFKIKKEAFASLFCLVYFIRFKILSLLTNPTDLL